MKLKLALCVAALTAACAGTPQPETAAPAREVTPAVNPVGVFDFTTSVDGMVVNGTLTVTRNAQGGYEGSIATNVTETIPVRTVTVSGQTMNVAADTPDGTLTLVMEFQGQEFTGSWILGGMSGTHSGKRRS